MSEITYTSAGDYLLPCIRLSDPPDAPPLGFHGTAHKEHLRTHRPALHATLLLSERLYPLCREVDAAAAHRLATIADGAAALETIAAELTHPPHF
jgi:hypothetical protein